MVSVENQGAPSASTTRAPSRAKSAAVARPIPCAPPVTTARLSFKRMDPSRLARRCDAVMERGEPRAARFLTIVAARDLASRPATGTLPDRATHRHNTGESNDEPRHEEGDACAPGPDLLDRHGDRRPAGV